MSRKTLTTIGGSIVPASLASTIVARWFTTDVGLATLQMWVMAASLLSMPIYLYFLMRLFISQPCRAVGFAAAATLAAWLIVPFGFSLLVIRTIAIDEKICARPELRSKLAPIVNEFIAGRPASESPTRETPSPANRIRVTAPPDVARDARGDIHVTFDFEWEKNDEIPAGWHWNRKYFGRIYLLSKARDTDTGKRCNDSFALKDFSIGPKQNIVAYLLGWFEAPFVMSEGDMISRWLQRTLANPDGCTLGTQDGTPGRQGG
jgi:hypothetical protein